MRRDVPFYGNTDDDTHCFQAALCMALGYFFPHRTFSFAFLDEISGKGKDMWTWPYAAMIWFAQQGFVVRNIELFDTLRFAQEGYEYLVSFFGKDVAAVQAAHADITLEQRRAAESIRYIQFEKRIPTLFEVKKLLLRGFVVLCMVNSRALREKEGYVGHTVVVTDVTADEVVFHDPGLPHRPFVHAPHELFEKAWGYPNEAAKNILALRKRNLFERAAIFLTTFPIRVYQKTLSYDHGPMKALYPNGFCQFYPSCSEYNVRAIEKYGVIRGVIKGVWRIFRCHPWAKGGVDEP